MSARRFLQTARQEKLKKAQLAPNQGITQMCAHCFSPTADQKDTLISTANSSEAKPTFINTSAENPEHLTHNLKVEGIQLGESW